MLTGALILVAEDQAFIALELALTIEDAGGKVAGPVASVKDALALIEEQPINAAILDFNLIDGDSVPIISALTASQTPIIIQSGIGLSPELMARFPNLVVFIKPCDSGAMVCVLRDLIKARGQVASD